MTSAKSKSYLEARIEATAAFLTGSSTAACFNAAELWEALARIRDIARDALCIETEG